MVVQIKCAFCGTPFVFDASGKAPTVDCPHCGKSNPAAAPTGTTSPKPYAPCENHVAPQQRAGEECECCGNTRWIVTIGAAFLLLVAITAFLFRPKPENSIPVAPIAAPAVAKPTPPSPTTVETSAQPVPSSGPVSEEIATQKAEADHVEQEAEQALRQQLDESEPLYKINETVELRRTNGFIDKGTLTSFSGTGTGRVALVATPTHEIGVPLESLDSSSRRRLDPDFREAYIAHRLSTQKEQKASE